MREREASESFPQGSFPYRADNVLYRPGYVYNPPSFPLSILPALFSS